MTLTPNFRRRAAQVLIGIVFLLNIQCAVLFISFPERYAPAYELSGTAGAAAVRGMGILFLMWNVPYAFALWHPLRFQAALLQALIMQSIGWIGENSLYVTLPGGHPILAASILRFIGFDGAGVVLLLSALSLIRRSVPLNEVSE